MSLINNMLQDLEHRRGGRPLQGHQILSGLDPVGMIVPADAGWHHARPLALMALSLAIPVLAWLVYQGQRVQHAPQTQQMISTEKARSGLEMEQEVAAAARGEARSPVKAAVSPSDGYSKVMVVNDPGVSVPVWFGPSSSEGPVPAAKKGRKQLRPVSGEGIGSVGAAPAVGGELRVSARIDNDDASRQTTTLASVETSAKDKMTPTGRFQRESASAGEQVALRLRAARVQLADDQIDAALAGFRAVLRQAPGNDDARGDLANTLVRIGRSGAAQRVLEAGLKRDPKAWPLALSEARILVARTEIGQAAKLLEAHRPGVEQAPEYYAYMAGLAQRQGDDDRAVSLYRRITAQDGTRGVWWMGLAISLRRENRRDEALRAFQRAYMDKTLSDNLRHYIDTQIAKLQRDGP